MIDPAPHPARSGGISTRAQLAKFALALMLPVLAFVGVLLFEFAASERIRIEAEALAKARDLALAVDREIGGLTAALNVLAASPALRAEDLEGFYRQAAEVRSRTGHWVILRDFETGQQLVNTRLPWGAPLPKSNVPKPSGAELRGGQVHVSNLLTGAVSQAPVFVVELPIERGGRIAWMLSLPVSAQAMRDLLMSEEGSPGHRSSIARTSWSRATSAMRSSSASARRRATSTARGAARASGGGVTLEGYPVFGVYARSRLSDWRVGLGVREEEVRAPLRRSLAWLASLGLGALALALLLARVFGRRIAAPVYALRDRAFALGRGEPVQPIASPSREVNQVGLALAEASASLRRREADNARLAAIVASSSDAIISFAAADGRILTWNKGPRRCSATRRPKPSAPARAFSSPPPSNPRGRTASSTGPCRGSASTGTRPCGSPRAASASTSP